MIIHLLFEVLFPCGFRFAARFSKQTPIHAKMHAKGLAAVYKCPTSRLLQKVDKYAFPIILCILNYLVFSYLFIFS
ncbi:MAG: hypothetical protein D6730_08160 [Bacteroidetes bacterium]|nr:MAG: hypothetical protein D6730_08160 [Bacteroidota bacterium]